MPSGFKNRGKDLGTGFKNRGPVLTGGKFTNRGAEDQAGRTFKNRGQAWFPGGFVNRGPVNLSSGVGYLFSASEVGVWYDPSDLSSMFQNSNGTVAAVVGQPVGYIADKSGNGKHATQATTGNKPTLRQSGSYYYLEFDGTDDWLETAAINFSSTNKMSVFAGVRKSSATANGVVVEHGSGAAPAFALFAPNALSTYRYSSGGTTLVEQATSASYAEPITNIVTGLSDIAAPSIVTRVNGAVAVTNTASQGTGNYGNLVLYIGRRAGSSLPLNGNLYSLIVRGVTSNATEIASAESYVNSKTGAY